MRRARLMMGIGVLVVLSAAACAAPHQDSVEGPGTTRTATSESLVGSEPTTNVADASASGGGSGMIDPVPANTTTTTSPTPAARRATTTRS